MCISNGTPTVFDFENPLFTLIFSHTNCNMFCVETFMGPNINDKCVSEQIAIQ